MEEEAKAEVKGERWAGLHIRRRERKLITRMSNDIYRSRQSLVSISSGCSVVFFQINTALQVIVFHLLFATITLSYRLGYGCPQAQKRISFYCNWICPRASCTGRAYLTGNSIFVWAEVQIQKQTDSWLNVIIPEPEHSNNWVLIIFLNSKWSRANATLISHPWRRWSKIPNTTLF